MKFYIKSWLILLFSLLSISHAQASLGASESSVDEDTRLLSAQDSATEVSQYRIRTLTLPTTTIKEYIAENGKIFAVTWRGAARPDFSVLLGSYYQEYREFAGKKARAHGRRPTAIATEHMTFKLSGHMRDLKGRAYIGSMVPAGVNAEDLP